MASLVVPILIGLLVAVAVLHVILNRKLAAWLLVLFPASLCGAALADLSRGAEKLGQTAYESDQKQLVYCFFLLALSLTAALRPKWLWLFWIAWVADALVCGIFVYLACFWKAFS
ncbi:MAG: hypothetical protein WAM85_21495 [Terracidiphilus sp.]